MTRGQGIPEADSEVCRLFSSTKLLVGCGRRQRPVRSGMHESWGRKLTIFNSNTGALPRGPDGRHGESQLPQECVFFLLCSLTCLCASFRELIPGLLTPKDFIRTIVPNVGWLLGNVRPFRHVSSIRCGYWFAMLTDLHCQFSCSLFINFLGWYVKVQFGMVIAFPFCWSVYVFCTIIFIPPLMVFVPFFNSCCRGGWHGNPFPLFGVHVVFSYPRAICLVSQYAKRVCYLVCSAHCSCNPWRTVNRSHRLWL